jgi:two-component system NarL family sensor kinase
MTAGAQDDGGDAATLAFLRVALLAVIFVSEQWVEARPLAGPEFFLVFWLAVGYALVGIAVALRPSGSRAARALARVQPALDVLFLTGLTCTSGGAFSDVRRAFFVIPLAAAFSERPRSTASWSLLAVAAFSAQAVVAGGHPMGAHNSWLGLTVNQDLYLGWSGVAATMLALMLRRRTAHTRALALSRQRLVTQAIESEERERTRLAGALHDFPVQNLIAARHDLHRAERSGDPDSFARLGEAIDVTIAELREEIFNLHPHVLDHVGLSAALEQVARRHARDAGMRVTVEIDSAAAVPHRQLLFAVGRELLANAAKHSRATEIRLSVTREANGITLEVVDDGCGIPDGQLRHALLDGHIGLAAVSERVAALGGTLQMTTAQDAGTTIRVALPAPKVENPRHETSFRRSRSARPAAAAPSWRSPIG